MPTTDTFYVRTKDNKVKKPKAPSREYFVAGSKYEGQAKYFIEVFGYNHEETAKKVRDMVDKAGMQEELFHIKVETK
jgi:hypothetical protein